MFGTRMRVKKSQLNCRTKSTQNHQHKLIEYNPHIHCCLTHSTKGTKLNRRTNQTETIISLENIWYRQKFTYWRSHIANLKWQKRTRTPCQLQENIERQHGQQPVQNEKTNIFFFFLSYLFTFILPICLYNMIQCDFKL